jgi:hypothetical protein
MARFYSNENFPLPVVLALRQAGHDVLTSYEAGNANQRIPDEQVLAFATRQARALRTLNRQHFMRLHRRNSKPRRDRRMHGGRRLSWTSGAHPCRDREKHFIVRPTHSREPACLILRHRIHLSGRNFEPTATSNCVDCLTRAKAPSYDAPVWPPRLCAACSVQRAAQSRRLHQATRFASVRMSAQR